MPLVAPASKTAAPWILAATILGSSMAFIDGTVVNIALPALQKDLNASVLDVQWVVESYSLFLAALLLVGGSLGDRLGRRLVYTVGVALFALASLWCGLSPSVVQLIIARSFQGVGAALLVPGSLAIISASFPESERGKAIGTWSGFTSITAALGPVLGGWLIEKLSWRAAFFLNLPIAIVVLALTLRHVPEIRAADGQDKLDLPGAALATAGLGCLVYGLIESSGDGRANSPAMLLLILGVALLIAFFIIEARTGHPMLPLTIFRSRAFSGANVETLLLYGALGGALFFLPLDLIQVQRYSATAAGAAMLPFILIIFLLSSWAGGLAARFGARLPLVVGPLVSALGYVLLGLSGLGNSYWTGFFPGLAVLGLGMALSIAPLTTTIMNSVGPDQAGAASGINNAVSRTAGLLAVAVFGVAMLQTFNGNLGRRLDASHAPPQIRKTISDQRFKLADIAIPNNTDPKTRLALEGSISEAFVSGFRIVMFAASVLAALSALIGFLTIEDRPAPIERSVESTVLSRDAA